MIYGRYRTTTIENILLHRMEALLGLIPHRQNNFILFSRGQIVSLLIKFNLASCL